MVAGISHWRFGRFDLYKVNPPLLRLVATAPVAAMSPAEDWRAYSSLPADRSERGVRDDFLRVNSGRVFWLHTIARWSVIPFAWIGLSTCFTWARRLYGTASGLTAASLWCFSPTVLGHAQLITPDAAAASLGVLAGYCFWCWLQAPSTTTCIQAGLALGLAEATKTSWISLYAVCPAIWIVDRWLRLSPGASSPCHDITHGRVSLVHLCGILCLGIGVVNVVYAFEGSFCRLDGFNFQSRALGGDETGELGSRRFQGTLFGKLPVPFPKNYVYGIDLQRSDSEQGLWSYLYGVSQKGGWYHYYLYAFLVKVPVGTILLAASAALLSIGQGGLQWRQELALLLPPLALLLLVSAHPGVNVGLRYALPAFPFLFVWASKVVPAVAGHWAAARLVAVLLVWSISSGLATYPHSLSYFNELAGGPRKGATHLLDSNIDWGQDLLFVKEWLSRHHEVETPYLAYYVDYIDPQVAGIRYRPLPEAFPAPGWYIVSVNKLYDRAVAYEYLHHLEPIDRIGYSMYVYFIPAHGTD